MGRITSSNGVPAATEVSSGQEQPVCAPLGGKKPSVMQNDHNWS